MKVAIVGSAPSTEKLAPFTDTTWEIWSVGKSSIKHPRKNRVFEIHQSLKEPPQGYYDYLSALDSKIIVGENSPLKSKNAVLFPFAQAEKLFGRQYLTSTCAYMMAMAILEGAEEIAIYGIDMAIDDREYFFERPCMEAWLGLAIGKGIKITIPDGCPVLKSREVYGVSTKPKGDRYFTEAELLILADKHLDKIEELKDRVRHLEAEMHTHNGSAQSYQALAKVARAIESGQDIKKLSDQNFVR